MTGFAEGAEASKGALGPEARDASLAALKATTEPGKELDILVVGGGIVGAGTALDAVTRGLNVGIVEASDWAAGTSSRSSKLIHGGLRYLEMLDFGLVKEALQERGLLLSELAPHLARPVPFLYPLTKPFLERPYIGAGIALYDAMSISGGHKRGVPFHKHLSRRGTLRAAPSLKDDAFVGSIRYYDGQVDDAKYVANLIRTAAYYGAHAVNQVAVVNFLREGERVVGAKAVNHEDGSTFNIRAAAEAVGAARALVELATGVQPGEDDLDHRHLLFRVQAEGDAAAIVVHRDRAIACAA